MERTAGVLAHVTSLPNGYGCGGFGDECLRFVDFLVDCGFGIWQVLPFCLPDEYHSPYKSFSAFSGNPYMISLPRLARDGLISAAELEAARERSPYLCEFERLDGERLALLAQAAERAGADKEIDGYLAAHPQAERFCRYMARRAASENPEKSDTDGGVYRLWAFCQYVFDRQWKEVKAYANERGVRIVGDVPIYVSAESADVDAAPHLFDLTADGRPRRVAGCPPDYFAKDGQMWGNPLYDWKKMKEDGYGWWRERLEHMFEWFDGVRLDHFRGFSSFWAIPAGATTAREGKWVKGPGRAFVDMVRRIAAGRTVIAEDLGEETRDVEKLVRYSGFPGMRVLQFGFAGDETSRHVPFRYEKNCVAYSGTHDNDTLLGYIWEMDPAERQRLMRYCGCEGESWERACDEAIRVLYASAADTVILPLQDLLRFGGDTRMNLPGRASGNWAWRVTDAQLAGIDRAEWRGLARLYGRESRRASATK
ncbi:MAG: 4-alpha-glucanotransferase [Clostridia bacterium]|nr:4-alpha-glucanotransferase [Clostridia bacterium]